MKLFTSLHSLASNCGICSRADREMDEELREHIQFRADDLERSGRSRADAERQARIEFGGIERFKEECREAAGVHFFETLLQRCPVRLPHDAQEPRLHHGGRCHARDRNRGECGGFQRCECLVLRPMDLPGARNLFMVEYGKQHYLQSYPDYLDLRDRSRAFEGVMAFAISTAGVDAGHGSSQSWMYETSGNYFDVIGIQPYLGRFFHVSDEHGPDSAPYVVLSYGYWQNHFAGDHGVVGRTVQLNKYPYTVLGGASSIPGHGSLLLGGPLGAPRESRATRGRPLAEQPRASRALDRRKIEIRRQQGGTQWRSRFDCRLVGEDLPEIRRSRELLPRPSGTDGRLCSARRRGRSSEG